MEKDVRHLNDCTPSCILTAPKAYQSDTPYPAIGVGSQNARYWKHGQVRFRYRIATLIVTEEDALSKCIKARPFLRIARKHGDDLTAYFIQQVPNGSNNLA
jgi:hypothetical protein